MNTFRAISIALLAGGVILFFFGLNASNSFSSDVSRLVNGTATRDAMWMLIGGATAAAIGLTGLLSRTRHA